MSEGVARGASVRYASRMLTRLLKPNVEAAYVALRIVSGAMFAFHGAQKVLGVLATAAQRPTFPQQIWFGGVIELVGGVAIALGFFTTCAAVVASGTMAVAYIQYHWRLKGGAQLVPAINKGELAVLYCFLFLFVACKGGGKLSIDAARGKA
jgi:putative oxidoreductase